MINIKNAIAGTIGTALSLVGVGISADKLDHIVSIVCAITGLLITIVVSFAIPLIKWWRKSSADGKIDNEELDELGQIIQKGEDDLNKKKGE